MVGLCDKCSTDVKQENSLKCEGICNKIFHNKCMNITSRDFQIIQNIQGLKWYCESCNDFVTMAKDMRKEIVDVKSSILGEINELKNTMNMNEKYKLEKSSDLSYAKVVAGEALVIKPKNKQDSKKTQEAIKKNLKPVELEVGITQIKNVKDGGVLIKCNTKEEIEKVKKSAEKKMGKNYQYTIPEQKNPCVKILDFEENLNSDQLINCIIKQNSLVEIEKEKLKVVVIKKMKTRYMAIIECDPDSFKVIMDKRNLTIGWIPRCRVFEYVKIFRCFKCGGFNHRAEECKSDKCVKCGEVGHGYEECNNLEQRCINCLQANEVMNHSFNVNHSVFDHCCPVYQQKMMFEKQKIKNGME